MSVHRSFDAQAIATIAHGDDAIQWLCPGGELDWTAILENDQTNILIKDEETGSFALCHFRAPNWGQPLYEAHIACPVTIRGKEAVAATMRMLTWFDENVGGKIFTHSFAANRRVRFFMPLIGFRAADERDGLVYYERIGLSDG